MKFLFFLPVGIFVLYYCALNGLLLAYAFLIPAFLVGFSVIQIKRLRPVHKGKLASKFLEFVLISCLFLYAIPIYFLQYAVIDQWPEIVSIVGSHKNTIETLYSQWPFSYFKTSEFKPDDLYENSKILLIDIQFTVQLMFMIIATPFLALLPNHKAFFESKRHDKFISADFKRLKIKIVLVITAFIIFFILAFGKEIFTGLQFYDYHGHSLRKRIFLHPVLPFFYGFYILGIRRILWDLRHTKTPPQTPE